MVNATKKIVSRLECELDLTFPLKLDI